MNHLATDRLLQVPVIDIGRFAHGDAKAKADIAGAVDAACRDIGFLVIAGHGIDRELIERTQAVSRRFFDLPIAEKMKVAKPAKDVTRGYIGVAEESVARSRDRSATAGDLNESFMIGPVDLPPVEYAQASAAGKHFAPNLWPASPPELREAYTDYYRAMSALAGTLMRIFAIAIGVDEHFFDDKIDRHISRLRVRNYPQQLVEPLPGQIRAGAHSDYGSLTILAAEDKPGGLQVHNLAGDWVDVPIVPDTFIVNLGDLLARWTNDRWVSTLHRVVNPPAGSGAESRRQSLVFFHNPNYDAPIACLPHCAAPGESPRYAPTTSGEHLRALFVATQNG
ncbi:2-oxoglutarate and iron-dependent oxygenase domain-containing protein [soil metagenome]